ncbi:hypothetical protein [Nostoc sp. TCL240-02]|uniref:hypothetical protein n=1 Tax=Nostoc sp. TCL240-02 TaxID=2572090 RepID=UPI00157F8B1C|nr:hypothetical protein [Nostoc sp. TCL240-02]QKQ75642.1 hypothetical protein FBB35_22205 [Nostoc sp. TCL240-02]
MNINNGQLLSLLFDQPKLAKALNQAIPYISVFRGKTTLNLRCASFATLSTLLEYRQEIFGKINPLLGYEICLECEETGDNNMVATAERITETRSATERFLSLETLAKATSKSPQEVKMLLGRAKEVIHPTEHGAEMITETAFDSVVLEWARSFKDDITPATTTAESPSKTKSSRSPATKLLSQRLVPDDIAKTKGGKSVGSANLTVKGIQITLENFFNKVRLDDTTIVDAVSAFIEGTSEFGMALRKELLAVYKRSFKGLDMTEVETKLIAGAKAYLEKSNAPETAEVQG